MFSFHVSPRSGSGGNRTHFQELKRLLLAIELQTQTSRWRLQLVRGDHPFDTSTASETCFFAFDYSVFSEHVDGSCSCFCRGASRLSGHGRNRTFTAEAADLQSAELTTCSTRPKCGITLPQHFLQPYEWTFIGALSSERAAGIEPALQPWQGRARPLRHARIFRRPALPGLLGSSCRADSSTPWYRDYKPFFRAPGENRTPVPGLRNQCPAIERQGHRYFFAGHQGVEPCCGGFGDLPMPSIRDPKTKRAGRLSSADPLVGSLIGSPSRGRLLPNRWAEYRRRDCSAGPRARTNTSRRGRQSASSQDAFYARWST